MLTLHSDTIKIEAMLREVYFPSPELQGIISHYLVVEFTNKIVEVPCTFPKGACALAIFYSEEMPQFTFADSRKNYSGMDFVCGYLLKAGKLKTTGNIKVMVALFTALGTWRLFGIAPGEYFDTFIPFQDFVGSKAQLIEKQIVSANNPAKAVFYLDTFFKRLVKNRIPKLTVCDSVIRYIQANHGKIRIDEMTRILNLSSRTIDRHFEKYLGITPKEYAWLTRLNIAFNLMIYNSGMPIHEIIYDLGYYDQSHFINDVKRYLGVPPEFFKKNGYSSVMCHLTDFVVTNSIVGTQQSQRTFTGYGCSPTFVGKRSANEVIVNR
jgi:AraC-like DNA-binding protein